MEFGILRKENNKIFRHLNAEIKSEDLDTLLSKIPEP